MLFITSLLFGILSASFALVIEILILINALSSPDFFVLLGAAIIEELSKYIFLKQYAKRYTYIIPSSIKQASILGASFGLGFAILELSLMSYKLQITTIPLWAIFGSASIHIITSIIFAVFLFSFSQKRFTNLTAIALAIFLHILYNILVFVSLFGFVLL